MESKKFAVIGGDQRNIALAKLLSARGHNVKSYGFSNYDRENLKLSSNLYEAIEDADYVIGPIPCSHNGTLLNAAFHHSDIYVEDIFRLIKPNRFFLAGYIKEELLTLAEKYGVGIVDMLAREELLLLNAIPTAEGAIKIAIEETDITLHSNNIMVIGFGRVGAMLASMLKGIGAIVHMAVNTLDAAAKARCMGYEVVFTQDMNTRLAEMDIIFNTVPKILLDCSNMKFIRKNCLIIDLASPPYGVDYLASQKHGIRALYTNSLPGKVAPVTTAAYILETVYHIISELEG